MGTLTNAARERAAALRRMADELEATAARADADEPAAPFGVRERVVLGSLTCPFCQTTWPFGEVVVVPVGGNLEASASIAAWGGGSYMVRLDLVRPGPRPGSVVQRWDHLCGGLRPWRPLGG